MIENDDDDPAQSSGEVSAHSDFADGLAEPAILRFLLEQLHEGVVFCELLFDPDGAPVDYRYLKAYGSAEKLAGVAAVGLRAYEAHPKLEKFWLTRFSRVVETGEPAEFTHFAAPLGRWFHVRAYAYGKNRFVALFLDRTEQKNLAAKARQTQEAQNRASRLDAMGAMASTLAHELSQPLAAAVNYLAAIKRMVNSDFDVAAIRDAAAAAGAAHLRAGEIIKRMKSFTMEGRITTSSESIGSIVSTAAREALADPAAKGVLLHLDVPSDLHVLGDRLQLEQVFINLFRNAATAMRPQDSIRRISVTAWPHSSSVQVRVQDTGPGIPVGELPLVFDAFRSHSGGMGLGLPICRTIIEAHRGTIKAVSSNDGAAFRISLPQA